MPQTNPVIIIGAGPVGLSLALLLAQRNIKVSVYEALPQLNPQNRASTFHPPTLELFQEWGILDEVLKGAEVVRFIQYYQREGLQLIASFDYGLISEYTAFPFRIHYPQQNLTQILGRQFEAAGGELHFSHRLTGLLDMGDHVQATFEHVNHGSSKTVRGDVVCAADGANSFVRRHLEIPFEGRTEADRFLLIGSEVHLNQYIPNLAPVAYIFDPEEWVIVKRFKGGTRFTFRLDQAEDADLARQSSQVYRRIDRFIPRVSHNLRSVATYAVQQRVAGTFRKGRTVLMGDAAHVTNPIGGKGLNSGIHDAAYLAPILAEILNDGAPLQRLDDYASTRRNVALHAVNPSEEQAYADMAAPSHHERVARAERFQDIALDILAARKFLMRLSMLEDRIPQAN